MYHVNKVLDSVSSTELHSREEGFIITPILLMKKLRLKEVA